MLSIFLWRRRCGILGRDEWQERHLVNYVGPSELPEGSCVETPLLLPHLTPSVFLLAHLLSTSVARVMKSVADLTARQLGHCPVGLVVMLLS